MPSNRLAELSLELQHLIHAATARLEEEFSGTFGSETIERFVGDSLDQLLPRATIMSFLPLLTEKFARERLRALAKVEGHDTSVVPSVLFLCVHNAGRSQMAAGWLRHLAGENVVVYTGGSEPAGEVNPSAIEAMAEVGIDIRSEFPKPWTDEVVQAADVVVTMGCGDACPLLPGKRYLDWELDDPAGQPVEVVRRIRDDIRVHVERLIASVAVSADR
jgi:arsenate reductase (thioredoxin)